MSFFALFKKRSSKTPQQIRQDILAKIKPILASQFEIDENSIIPSAKLIEVFGADSLDTVELVMTLEEEFDIEIPDEDTERMKTVDDIITYLMKATK